MQGDHYIEMIRKMVKRHIKPKHVIIVKVLSGSDDMENQVSAQIRVTGRDIFYQRA